MATLTELSASRHANLKVRPDCVVDVVGQQHVVTVRAAEVGLAAGGMPIFVTASPQSGQRGLSALVSFENGENMMVEDGRWVGHYEPSVLRSYPLFLMQSDSDPRGYAVGIDESSTAFSETEGEALFDDTGNASAMQSQRTKLLEAGIDDDRRTQIFVQRLGELGLLRSVDVLVQYASGEGKTIQGLQTIDEDTLMQLESEALTELHRDGYLLIMHAMLLSISQVNRLIRAQNNREHLPDIAGVKLQSARDAGEAV
ncbi:MAG: SapC family protein [Pseudomonadota bacterium]